MGKLTADLWQYEYKGKKYHGIVEVVLGDLERRSVDNKRETKIDKAFAFMQKDSVNDVSHFSLQSYNTYLEWSGRTIRDKNDEAYYPFFVEFEPEIKPNTPGFMGEYRNAVIEANKFVSHLTGQLGVHPEDLLITVTNSRSVYIFVNPKTYELRPSARLNEIYRSMFKEINEELQLECVDLGTSFRRSGVIKTPGSFYCGGYVNSIGVSELKSLESQPGLKEKLTQYKREVERRMPAEAAEGFAALYNRARKSLRGATAKANETKQIQSGNPQKKTAYIKAGTSCAQYFESNKPKKSTRNHALVSLAIAHRNANYTEKQVIEILTDYAEKWGHDESAEKVAQKAKTVFRNGTQFSCKFVKDNLKLPGSVCAGCRFNKAEGNSPVRSGISRDAVALLWDRGASLKHYKAYLVLIKNGLFGEFFDPEEYGLDQRTVREFAKYIEADRKLENGLVSLRMTLTGKSYVLPESFYKGNTIAALGESLKQFLVIYTHSAYKATDRYSQMRVKPQRVQDLLGYKTIRSVYKLIEKWVKLGFAVFKKGYLFALYFESYKVVDLEDVKKLKKERIIASVDFNPGVERVVGLLFPNDNEVKWRKLGRGSP